MQQKADIIERARAGITRAYTQIVANGRPAVDRDAQPVRDELGRQYTVPPGPDDLLGAAEWLASHGATMVGE